MCCASMSEVPKVDDVRVLLDKLGWVGTIKLNLPIATRWWLNELGLYVQLHYAAGQGRLQAGGKYRSYLDAWGSEGEELNLWEVRKYDKETWNRRFAHLVWPTYEVALFVGGPVLWDTPLTAWGMELGKLGEVNDAMFQTVARYGALKIKQAIAHFNKTHEWLGLLEWRCKTCGQRLDIWQLQDELCPYCGGKIRD